MVAEGLLILRLEAVEEERCWRVGVGCERLLSSAWLELVCEALLATEAECCARRAESSRVRRLTCVGCVRLMIQ